MIINALASVGRSYEETRNVTITLATLIAVIFVTTVQYPLFVVYLWLFSGGMAIGVFVLQRYVTPPSIWILGFLFKLKYRPYSIAPVPLVKYVQCPVCEKQNCKRHEVRVKSDEVWRGIRLPAKVDERLEEFCQLILVHYVYYWYHPISQNEDFLQDLRCLIRFVVASIIRIIMELDIGQIATEKLIPLGVIHLERHVRTKERYPEVTDRDELADLTLYEYGEDLHIALTSDENEERYLRSLVEMLLPYVTPENRMTSQLADSFVRELVSIVVVKRGVELVAHPDFLNLLIRMLMDPDSMREHKEPPSPQVELLARFVGGTPPASPYYTLEDLLFNPTNLYSFMQYLRKQGAINLLQCCLTAKDKIQGFDTSPGESEIRFSGYKTDIRRFYDQYFARDASDRIDFPEDICSDLKKTLLSTYQPGHNPFKHVLERVYEYLTEYLRNHYCVGYCQSDQFYLLLVGDRAVPSPKLSSWSKMRKQSVGGIGAMFTTIKDKLSHNTMDPMMEILDEGTTQLTAAASTGAAHASGMLGAEPEELEQIDFNLSNNLDLSKWIVGIQNTELQGEWIRQYIVYVIDVKTDTRKPGGGWERMIVKRRFSEFVMLQKRLRKFHGSMSGLQLPQRRAMNPLNSEFITYRKRELGIYLQKMLKMDSLQHSELVFKFLSPSCDDFNKIGLIGMPKQAIGSAGEFAGKMMSGVRPKEKNLHLTPFLKSVCRSVGTGQNYAITTSSQSDYSNASTPQSTPTLSRRGEGVGDPVPETPTGVQLAREMQVSAKNELQKRRTHDGTIFIQLTGVTECAIYALLLLGDLPSIVIHALCSLFLVIKKTLDHFVISFINFKINLVLQEKEVVEIIELARDVLFFDEEVRGPIEWAERADLAKHELLNKLPRPIRRVIGVERLDNALLTIYNGLQNQRLNKQLIYTLLDMFLGEVLKDLREREDILIQQDDEDQRFETPE